MTSYEINNKKGNAYKSSQLAGVFLGVRETIHTYILYRYLPKGAFKEQWLYYIIYNN